MFRVSCIQLRSNSNINYNLKKTSILIKKAVKQKADLIITMGQRFAVKNIFGKFGANANIVAIDIDKEELKSPLVKVNLGINLPLNIFIKRIKGI